MPIIYGVLVVGGLFGIGYAADKAGEAAEGSAKLAKWAAIGGAVYLAYRGAKAGGYLK